MRSKRPIRKLYSLPALRYFIKKVNETTIKSVNLSYQELILSVMAYMLKSIYKFLSFCVLIGKLFGLNAFQIEEVFFEKAAL